MVHVADHVVSVPSRSHKSFQSLPRQAQAYVGAAVIVGAGLLVHSITQVPSSRLWLFFGLLTLSSLTSAVKISLPVTRSGSTLSLSYVVNFAAMLMLGPWAAVPIAAVSGWSQCTFRMREPNPWHQTLFSMATLVISLAVAGLTYAAVSSPGGEGLWWAEVGAVAVTATAYFVLNTGLVANAIALSSREPVFAVWQKNFLWSAPSYYVGAGVAALVLEVAQEGRYWTALAFSLPVFLTYRGYRAYSDRIAEEQRQVRELSDVQLATIEALALAIEAKDSTSHEHLQQMQTYAEGLARGLGMTEPDIRGVKTAVLLHDIGNLAVPEHILAKPGPLTSEEIERVRIDPRIGAEIIKSVPFPYPVATLIQAHHERWDGRGYPNGLKGEDIPIGARILAVTDCFTAMLSRRPYRPARTYAEAIATLRENGGSALDPSLVERFIDILPDLEYQVHQGKAYAEPSAALESVASGESGVAALTDIAFAHREEQLLRDISQALSASLRVSDTFALISSRMISSIPFFSCALFLLDDASKLLLCRHVTGIEQDAIRTLTSTTTEGLNTLLPPAAPVRGVRIQSAMVAPIVIDQRTIGALAVYHVDQRAYTAEHRRMLDRVAAQATPVIANAVVFEETQEQSLTDVLTGLPNRRFFDRQLGQELARAGRHGGHVSLLVLDMDRFKQINDEFGHQAGDRALREVAHALHSSLRVYDLCARFAGDEFVVVLVDCDQAHAERRRQELQDSVNSVLFEAVPGHTATLSVSVGAATFPDDGQTADALMAVADHRMYRDKAQRKRPAPRRPATVESHLWR